MTLDGEKKKKEEGKVTWVTELSSVRHTKGNIHMHNQTLPVNPCIQTNENNKDAPPTSAQGVRGQGSAQLRLWLESSHHEKA